MVHLWECEHQYYCSGEEGYSARHETFQSFKEILEGWGDCDPDYNLLFRWDWVVEDDANVGTLTLCFMQQRHGKFVSIECPVCAADEPAVVKFIQPYWEHMKALWAPFSEQPKEPAE